MSMYYMPYCQIIHPALISGKSCPPFYRMAALFMLCVVRLFQFHNCADFFQLALECFGLCLFHAFLDV